MSDTNTTPPASLLCTRQQHPEDPDEDFLPDDPPEPAQLREGLPPAFRMRHDSHYVDHLQAGAPGVPLRLLPRGAITTAPLRDDADLAPLVSSIAQHGLLQPLLVRHTGSAYELIAGRRRLAAAAAAGLERVPCFVHDVDPRGAERLAAAEALRVPEAFARDQTTSAPPKSCATRISESADQSAVLGELGDSIAAIGTCLALLPQNTGSARARVGGDLIRAELARAEWLVQAAHVLGEDPTIVRAEIEIATLIAAVIEALAPECRVSSVDLAVDLREPRFSVSGDARLIAAAIGGVALSTIALLQKVHGGRATLRVTPAAAPQALTLEIAQSVVALPPAAMARLFDAQWAERPGGAVLGVLLLAARRIAQLHGGRLDALTEQTAGMRFRLEIPTAGNH